MVLESILDLLLDHSYLSELHISGVGHDGVLGSLFLGYQAHALNI
jgi:hypothetical protein